MRWLLALVIVLSAASLAAVQAVGEVARDAPATDPAPASLPTGTSPDDEHGRSADGTWTREYAVLTGSSATGSPNCDQAIGDAPALEGACFELDHWYQARTRIVVDDASGDMVHVRAVYRDSGGNHLATYHFCSHATYDVPIWATQLEVWVQPAWAGMVKGLDGGPERGELPCEDRAGTRGTVAVTLT